MCFLFETIANVLVAFKAYNMTSTSVQKAVNDVLGISFPRGRKFIGIEITSRFPQRS